MLILLSTWALAQDTLSPGSVSIDPQTLTAVGVQWFVSGDDNRDATVSVRYREQGAAAWKDGPPLFRVHPETVTGWSVSEQFAGSVFDLAPDTTWEIELHAVDPDGADQTEVVLAETRAVPVDPPNPNVVSVTTTAELQTALGSAAPGDVIALANGDYDGPFQMYASGTAGDPIVIRGESNAFTTLNGGSCDSCNVLEIYGSYVHIETLMLRDANRALRFQGQGAVGNVVRRVHIESVDLGIGANTDQTGFTLCDNVLLGPLDWPHVYTDDGGQFSNVDGIVVMGSGHVVCHNRLHGWGDGLKMGQDGGRANDFYGNQVLDSYDNALEFDGGEGNIRALRNHFINSYAPISFQPVRGGPAYAIRNIVYNVAHEPLKFHAVGIDEETSGILVWHNTVFHPEHALKLSDSSTSHNFDVRNNLFIGPDVPPDGRTVDWTGEIDQGMFDNNGWYPPNARFDFGSAGDWPDLAAMQADGTFGAHGIALTRNNIIGGLMPPGHYAEIVNVPNVELEANSLAIDTAEVMPGINDDHSGAGPDLGALDFDCRVPVYGPRPPGFGDLHIPCDDTTTTPTGTGTTTDTDAAELDSTGDGQSGGEGDIEQGGCGCQSAAPTGWLALVLIALCTRRSRW